MTDPNDLQTHLLAAIEAAAGLDALEVVRVEALGKQGRVTQLLKTLGAMTPEQRQVDGPPIQALREAVATAIATRKGALDAAALAAKLVGETIDLTLPIDLPPPGSVHPVSQVMDELAEIFADLGFAVATGPEIEDDWHNFTALNIPETHPARAMHDTFYVERSDGTGERMVLRTHTSPVQIRTMVEVAKRTGGAGEPIRIIAPGRVYRSDWDATHTPMFHQIEGLVIDRGITLGHLKWTLETFLKAFFERDDIVLRLRPSYFPFTEPSVEVDVGWSMEKGRRVLGGQQRRRLDGAARLRHGPRAGTSERWARPRGVAGLRLRRRRRSAGDAEVRHGRPAPLLRRRWPLAPALRLLGARRAHAQRGSRRMKFTLSWLKEHLTTGASLDQIADALTRVGLEVEGIRDAGAALAPFRVARVLSAERHPQADKLQVLQVDAGDGPLQVVCGAPNARVGLIGVFGAPGTHVPGPDITLRVATIRGVESNGMMCSTRELQLGDEHDGIIELAADAPIGASYAAYAGLTDPVIEVSVTPNRPDCMGVRGIARDLAAFGLGKLRPLAEAYRMGEIHPVEGSNPPPEVRTDDADGCPAFYAQAVAGVTNGAAPDWMRRRLEAIGQKPISVLVDITNFVSVDLGRPLHVYDRAKLTGPLVARKARAGETVEALNGRTYALTQAMTVIADDTGVHDIGGIMGGAHSGVSADTTDVLIECAYFDPAGIARTGQALQLTSDARQRFERGVDPAFLDDGLAIATRLVLDHCGGKPSAVTRSGTPPVAKRVVVYDPHLARDLGGLAVPPERQARILLSLGFTMGAIDHPDAYSDALFATIERAWPVTVPTWRPDIDGPADLVEEVIRIVGLDDVPSVPLDRIPGVAKPTATPVQKLERRVRRAAAARGLDEAVTWSFIPEVQAAAFGGGAWTVANPISEELRVMRPSLLPGLLSAAARNARRGSSASRLFELGRRYLADGEPLTLGLVLTGERRARGWREGKSQPFDAYDAKSEALALLAQAGAPIDNLQVMGEAGEAWHPGQSGTLRLGPKTVLARFGILHPTTLKAFDLDGAVAAAELYLDAIPGRRGSGFARSPYAPPALQAVRRDFAFTVPTTLAADILVRAIRGVDKASIVAARVFDVFEREGDKSMAVEVTLQPGDKAFVDAELKAIADKVVAVATKLGATLRG